MLGRSHVVLGALGWLALAPQVATAYGTTLEAGDLAVSTAACAGAALLPDLDHPKGTVAQALGPVTRAMAKFIGRVSGGHRNATHGLLFAGIAAATTQLIVTFGGHTASLIVFGLFVSFAVRALKPPRGKAKGLGIALVSGQAVIITAFAAQIADSPWEWLPYAVGAGAVFHLVGDLLTDAGVPLFWPFRTRFSVPLLGFPGDADEKLLTVLMSGGVVTLAFLSF